MVGSKNINKKIYELTNELPFKRDQGLSRQTQGAAVSIMANIAEGFDKQSKRELIKFLYYAPGSASEVQSHLYVALDQNYISEVDFHETYDQAKRTKGLINGFISCLKGKK